jgi:hypothetical protein
MRRKTYTIGLLVAALSLPACGRGGRAEPDTAADDASGQPARGGEQLYGGSFTVLEDASHGPQLCAVVAQSLPPQCDGPDIVGWDWDAVDGEETMGEVTWGSYHVTGSYAGGVFTLTAPAGPPRAGDDGGPGAFPLDPACDEPEVIDPTQGSVQWGTLDLSGPELVATWVNDGPAGTWDGPFVGNVVVLPGAGPAIHDRIRQTYGGRLCVVERQAATADDLARITIEVMDADAAAHFGQPVTAGPNVPLGAVRVEVWVADQPALAYAQQRWGDLVVLQGLLQPVS